MVAWMIERCCVCSKSAAKFLLEVAVDGHEPVMYGGDEPRTMTCELGNFMVDGMRRGDLSNPASTKSSILSAAGGRRCSSAPTADVMVAARSRRGCNRYEAALLRRYFGKNIREGRLTMNIIDTEFMPRGSRNR
jgi:hypothetical protein